MNREQLIDLDKKQLGLLKKIIRQHIPDKTVWAYGSRVTWKADEISDLDLTVFECNSTQISSLKEEFEESDLLISVDVMDWESIPEKFKENIKRKYVVLQRKTKLEGWREVRLGDVAELSKTSWKLFDEPYPYIGLEHINENKLRLNGIGDSNSVASNKYRFNSGDILFGKLRPYFRKVVLAKFDGICSTDIWVVKPKDKTDNVFLFYFFANPALVNISYSTSNGTRMPRADWNFLADTLWQVPPLPEQKAIAEILSSLDDKIDLLHRQNKTLENIAQTLFRQWFVEDADEGWEEKPLDEIADYLNGLACQKHPAKNEIDKLPVLKIKELRNGCTENSDWATSEIEEKYIIEIGDIIFSWSGSLMLKIWDGQKCVLNQHLFKVTSEQYPKWFYYFWTKHYLEKFIAIADSKATTMGHIKRGDLSSSMVLTPTDSEIRKMDKKIIPVFEKNILNSKQIRTLENLRDTLLPKLMNGEVRI